MKHTLLLALMLISTTIWAHGGNTNTNEDSAAEVSMIPLPIRIGLNGNIMWGYRIAAMGGMGHMGGGMGHGDMNNGGMNNGGMNNGGMNNGGMNNGGMNNGGMNNGGMNNGGMNNGGMNNGGMNNGGMNNGGHMGGGMKMGWMYGVMPMLTLSGDTFSRSLNLAKDNTKSLTLELDNDSAGFLSMQNKSIQVGGGAGIMAMPPSDILSWGFKFNLLPYKGGHVFRQKHIDSKKDLKTVKNMKIPHSLVDLDEWRVNDTMTYSSRGGIMFGAGAGLSILVSAMVNYMAQGEWITSVSKVGKTQALVTLRRNKTKMFGAVVMNVVAESRVAKMKNVDKNFNFIFDLETTEGLRAYRQMLNGNILYVQKQVAMDQPGIEMVTMEQSKTRGLMRKVGFGLPFLFNSSSMRGDMKTFATNENGYLNSKSKGYMTMYRRAQESDGVLSDHKSAGLIFMTMTRASLKNDVKGYAGTFKWYFQKDNTSQKFFKRQVKKLVKLFGADIARDIEIPNLKNMGFVRAEMDLAINAKNTKTLLALADKSDLYTQMYDRTFGKMKEFFNNMAKAKFYCGLNIALELCEATTRKKTWHAISQIPYLLKRMKTALENKQLEKFSTLYGKLGKMALTNRFVLAELFTLAGADNMNAVIKIQGSRISQKTIKL
jgi:hypothetical protein